MRSSSVSCRSLFSSSGTERGLAAAQLAVQRLVAVIVGTLLSLVFQQFAPGLALTQDSLVALPVFSSLSDFFTSFISPDWSQCHNQAIYSTALTIGIVASLESLLSVEAVDRIDPFRRRTPLDRELVSQGGRQYALRAARWSPDHRHHRPQQAPTSAPGGVPRRRSVFHGLLLLLATLFLAEVLNLIPIATLASVLLVDGRGLTLCN
nr:SulP family inorganic anion transporter [Pseudomonadota bacterium]